MVPGTHLPTHYTCLGSVTAGQWAHPREYGQKECCRAIVTQLAKSYAFYGFPNLRMHPVIQIEALSTSVRANINSPVLASMHQTTDSIRMSSLVLKRHSFF